MHEQLISINSGIRSRCFSSTLGSSEVIVVACPPRSWIVFTDCVYLTRQTQHGLTWRSSLETSWNRVVGSMNADRVTASHMVFPNDTTHTRRAATVLILFHHMCSYPLDASHAPGVACYHSLYLVRHVHHGPA
jgi:hypothetical protein